MRWIGSLLMALLPAPLAFAAPPPQTAPDSAGVVLVLPFATPAGAKDAWTGGAVQQDLITDLTQGTHTIIEAPSNAPPATDAGQAIKTARSLGASIVVYGQVQSTPTEVRLTGQVLDVDTGRVLGSLKVTGPSSELFHLEDALSGQALMALPHSMLDPRVLQAIQSGKTAQPGAGQPQQGPQVSPPQATTPPEQSVPPPDEYTSQQVPVTPEYQLPAAAPYTYTYSAPPDYAPIYSYPDYYSYDDDYGCPLPAYSYACPSIGLFPFGGFYGFVGGDFGGFGRGDFHHHWDHDGDHRAGHHAGGYNHGDYHSGLGAGGHTYANAGGGAIAGRGYAPRSGFSYGARPSVGYRAAPAASGFRSFRSGGFSRGLSRAPTFHSGGFGGGFHSAGGFRGSMGGGFHGGSGGGARR